MLRVLHVAGWWVVMGLAAGAAGETVTVSDDAGLRRALAEAGPGWVVRVEPGTYRGGLSATLLGEAGRRIVIEGSDASKPAVIEGGKTGLHLIGSRHVTLRNLVFRGASENGINADDAGRLDHSAVGIVIEDVRVSDVGPKGNHDGIKLSGLADFRVSGCVIEGWGGSAMDLVGCTRGVIERCWVRGKERFEGATGPQLKGGTSDVKVRWCVFEKAGQRAINAGGSTGLAYFRPADAGYEAKDLTIEHNVFIGGEAAVAFVGVDGAVFRRNTIVEPGKWVVRVLQESVGERFAPCRGVVFERNLIVYRRDVVRTVVNVGPNTAPETFVFRENWWWAVDGGEAKPVLPVSEGGGVYGMDPRLVWEKDVWPSPMELAAMRYGAELPER